MTTDAVLDSVVALVRAATTADLLGDIDSMAAGIESAGWSRDLHGGHWLLPAEPAWSLISSDHAPNLAVFFRDEASAQVFSVGQQLARRLDREPELARFGTDPGWPAWAMSDEAWAGWSGLDGDWVTWDGGPSRCSLNVTPAMQPGRVRVAPQLHCQIERLDTPPQGLAADEGRARRIARSGSSNARWYLAGEDVLTDDVVEILRHDEDPTVVAAVEAGARSRRMHEASASSRPPRELS